jgi:hypothetical protein
MDCHCANDDSDLVTKTEQSFGLPKWVRRAAENQPLSPPLRFVLPSGATPQPDRAWECALAFLAPR